MREKLIGDNEHGAESKFQEQKPKGKEQEIL